MYNFFQHTPRQFYRDTFKDLCFYASSCSGGGSGGGVTTFNTRTGDITLEEADVVTALGFTPPSNLQEVTDAGSTTTNSITVNAAVNGQIGAIGGSLANLVTSSGSASIIVQSETTGKNIITMSGTNNFLDTGGGQLSISTGSGVSVLNTFIAGQVTGADGTDPDHFVTLGQMQAANPFDAAIKVETTTTNDIPINIAAVTTVPGGYYTVQARVVTGTGADIGSFNISVMAVNNAGVLTIEGSAPLFTPMAIGVAAETDVVFVVSGTDIVLQVTGVAATTFEWKALLTVIRIEP